MENTQPQVPQATPKKGFSWRQATGILIIITLLAAGVWTAVQIGPYLPETVNNLTAAVVNFTQKFIPGERLLVYPDKNAADSGDEIQLTWNHRNKKAEGSYSISYPCLEKISLEMILDDRVEQLICDSEYEISADDKTFALIANSESEESIELPISMSFTKTGQELPTLIEKATVLVMGVSSTTAKTTGSSNENEDVIAENEVENTTKPEPIIATPAKEPSAGPKTEHIYPISTTTQKVAYGKADLSSKILEIGTVDKVTNVFTATTTFSSSDRVAVRFQIENVGTADSGTWYFSAVLPTFPMHIFQSESQKDLGPGDRIEYTIGFDNYYDAGDGRFVINADPNSRISEVSEENNIAVFNLKSN